jgi:hypothetical protein
MRNSKVITLLFAFLLSGCASLSTPPIPSNALGEYQQTIEQLRVESDRSLSLEYDLAYESYLARTRLTAGLDPEPFKLVFLPSGDFDWQVGGNPADQAEFVAIGNSRRQLNSLHQVLLDYISVLVQLNTAGTQAEARVEAATEKMTGSVSSLASLFGSPINETNLGIFGMTASAIAKKVIERKQNSSMAEVMSDFQPGVVKVSDLAAFAVAISASGIKESYHNRAQPIALKMATAEGSNQQKLLEQLLALNDRTTEQLELLRQLEGAYNALPGAHLKLIEAQRSGSALTLTSIIASIEAIADIRAKLVLKSDKS